MLTLPVTDQASAQASQSFKEPLPLLSQPPFSSPQTRDQPELLFSTCREIMSQKVKASPLSHRWNVSSLEQRPSWVYLIFLNIFTSSSHCYCSPSYLALIISKCIIYPSTFTPTEKKKKKKLKKKNDKFIIFLYITIHLIFLAKKWCRIVLLFQNT